MKPIDGNRPDIGQSIVFTYTDDLERASRFFGEALGFEFVVDQGQCHIFRVTGSSFIGVCDLPNRPSENAAVTISFVSDDVDGWHRFLTQKGIECIKEPSHSPQFGVYHAMFRSPDGYRIEVQRFDDEDWHRHTI